MRTLENRRRSDHVLGVVICRAFRWRTLAALSAFTILPVDGALAVSDPYIGEVITVAGDYCPVGFMQMSGQVLDTGTYELLYELIGTKYGDKGLGTFRLPTMAPTRTATGIRVLFCIAVDEAFTYPTPN